MDASIDVSVIPSVEPARPEQISLSTGTTGPGSPAALGLVLSAALDIATVLIPLVATGIAVITDLAMGLYAHALSMSSWHGRTGAAPVPDDGGAPRVFICNADRAADTPGSWTNCATTLPWRACAAEVLVLGRVELKSPGEGLDDLLRR